MSLKTPNLIDVPKDSPTRKERLDAFKSKHGIWTYGSAAMEKKDHPWEALLVPEARHELDGYSGTLTMTPIELIAHYCRLIEEWNLLVTGETERQAIEELCRLNNIPFDP